jgi:hypothetical protein
MTTPQTHEPPPSRGGMPRGVVLPDTPATAPTLWHFSEEPDIRAFVPRPTASNPDSEPLVWAIDDAHAPLYFFPRDCPRVAFWALPTSTPEDIDRLLGVTAARMVIAVEAAWLERIRACALYAFRLPGDAFVSLSDHGAHVSRETITPLSVEPVGDLLARLAERDVELRVTPSLWPLRSVLLSATLHYSMIRMRHASAPDPAAAEDTVK